MDEFQKNVAKRNREIKIVAALVVLLPFTALMAASFLHEHYESEDIRSSLEQIRPKVVLAIETYKSDNGHYPDFITNAVPRYYKGNGWTLHFLAWYEYRNLGTNFFLKDFAHSRK